MKLRGVGPGVLGQRAMISEFLWRVAKGVVYRIVGTANRQLNVGGILIEHAKICVGMCGIVWNGFLLFTNYNVEILSLNPYVWLQGMWYMVITIGTLFNAHRVWEIVNLLSFNH